MRYSFASLEYPTEGGCPMEDPEWEDGGSEGGETVTTAAEEDTNSCVHTAEGQVEEGEVEGEVRGGEGRMTVGARMTDGVVGSGEGSEEGDGREGEAAMSTSSGREGWMEEVVACCPLMEEGGAAEP
jgi:hypothetical protein